MDRQAVYLGQVPRSLDVLLQGQNSMVALAKLSEALLGTATVVSGFAVTGTSTPSLNVNVAAGQVYEVAALESTQLSGLAPDTHQIVKQGLTLDPTTLTLAPPTSVGSAVNVLIEVGYADVDAGPLVLTFQNPSAPGTTYQGPGGNGGQSNTVRKGVAQVRPVYGTATTAGQQTTPAPDAGFVGVAVVTLTYGQTTITSANVAPYSANYIPSTLTGIPSGVQSGAWVVGQATPAGTTAGTAAANTYATTLFSTAAYPFALTAGMEILVYFGQGNTTTSPVLNANGSGNLPMLKQAGGNPASGDIAGWVPFVLRNDKGAWLINGLATSDVLALIPAAAVAAVSANKTTLPFPVGMSTWTCPAGITKVDVYGRGAGGGGGGCTSGGAAYAAGGGGGGSYFTGTFAVTPGTAYTIVVGNSGTQGASAGSGGGVGGSTSFGSLATAPGGSGGGVANGSTNAGAGGSGGAIATAPSGVLVYGGSPGSGGQSVGGVGEGGAGGGSYGQGSTNLAAIGLGGGISGQFPGIGGNGGGGGAYPGGLGGLGELVIRY